jgi:FkbM family methyltransferase
MNNPEYGYYAPSALQRNAIDRCNRLNGRNWLNRKLASLFLRIARAHRVGAVFDRTIFGSQRARLHPGDNLSEKRVLMTPGFWDPVERELLRQALCAHTGEHPFVFVDVGANVGLYSLYMRAAAQEESKTIKIVAVESAPAVLERLRFNLDASQACDIQVLPWAVTERNSSVKLYLNTHNRGESTLLGSGEYVTVEGRTLGDVFAMTGSQMIDAMKIDIEGAELPALSGMFYQVEQPLWPSWIVIEGAAGGRNSEAIELCLAKGYATKACTRMNSVLKLERN